jgi:hypothetical protein
MSFALTTEAIRAHTKTVTRRLGWAFLKTGELVQPIVKGQGLKKGERVETIGGPIRIIGIRREPLWFMGRPRYGAEEVVREGFPQMTGQEFAAMFCRANGVTLDTMVTRIEFEYVEETQ